MVAEVAVEKMEKEKPVVANALRRMLVVRGRNPRKGVLEVLEEVTREMDEPVANVMRGRKLADLVRTLAEWWLVYEPVGGMFAHVVRGRKVVLEVPEDVTPDVLEVALAHSQRCF